MARRTDNELTVQDANGNKLYVYGVYDGDGNRYDAMATKPAVGDKVSFTSLPEGARVAVGDSEYTAENGKVSFTANADGAVKITITVGGSGEHIISYTVE